MEIVPGIHQINGVRGANCYLFITETGILVVDTGIPGNGNRIIDYVKMIGRKPSDINYIVLTHSDIDHTGSAAEMKKMTGAKLAIHAGDAGVLSGKSKSRKVKGLLAIIFKLMMPFMHFESVEPDIILKDNDDIGGLKVIHTPGHTDGSISLYQKGKVILVGDALRSDSKGNPRPPSKNISADIAQANSSLIAISKLEFNSLLPGHGAPVIGQASAKVKNLLAHLK